MRLAAVCAALLAAGCGSGEGEVPELPAGAPRPQRDVKAAVIEFQRALERGDCAALLEAGVHKARRPDEVMGTARPPTSQECRDLRDLRRTLAGYRAGRGKDFGTAAVIDATAQGQPVSSIFVVDVDREWVHYSSTPPGGRHQFGTAPKDPKALDRTVRAYLSAVEREDCARIFRLTNAGSPSLVGRSEQAIFCEDYRRATRDRTSFFRRVAASPRRDLRPLGKTIDFAFYGLKLGDGSYYTLILGLTPKQLPRALKRGHADPAVLDFLRATPE